MALYNLLHTELTCPRCGATAAMEVEFRHGDCNLDSYHLGDRLRWATRGHGRRPIGGSLDGEGYVECPTCEKDVWVALRIEADVIVSATPELERPGYIP